MKIMQLPIIGKYVNRLISVLFGMFLVATADNASAGQRVEKGRADYAKATYEETVTDMQVKVLGGYVKLKRVYDADGWHLNRNWQRLVFLDGANNQIRFLKQGEDTTQFSEKDILVYPGDAVPTIKTIRRDRYVYEPRNSTTPNVFADENEPEKQIIVTENGYRWNNRLGDYINYNKRGFPIGYGDKNNISVTFVYDEQDRISEVRDHQGNLALVFNYSESSKIIVSDWEGRSVTYHGEFPFIDKVTDVRGFDWQYQYEEILNKKYLIKKIDPLNRETIIGHVKVPGQIITVSQSQGEPRWELQEYTDPDTGEVLVREVLVNDTSAQKFYTYMAPDSVMYTHRINADGQRIDYQYSYNDNLKTYSLTEKNSDGITTETWYGTDGKIKRKLVGNKILFTRAEAFDGSKAIKADVRGRKTTFEYNQWKRATKITYPDGTFESFKYHTNWSLPVEYVDRKGNKQTWLYDEQGRLTQLTQGDGSAEARTTEYQYDQYGQVTKVTEKGESTEQDQVTEFVWDDRGNLTKITDPEGYVTEFKNFNAAGLATQVIDANGNPWTFVYDNDGNITSTKTPLGFEQKFSFDKAGQLSTITDAENHSSTYSWDAESRLIGLTNALGDTRSFQYGVDGRLLSMTDEAGHQISLAYDLQRRLKSMDVGEGLKTEYQYEDEDLSAASRISKIISPNFALYFSLNEQGQIVSQTQASLDESIKLTTEFAYNVLGLLARQTDAEGNSTAFEYTTFYETKTVTDADDKKTELTYDRFGRLISVKDAKGSITQYQYDKRGLKVAEVNPLGKTISYEWSGNRQLIRKTDAKGQVTQFTYDKDGRLTAQDYFASVTAANDSQATAFRSISYSYNKNGQLTGYDDGITNVSYTLDVLGRVSVAVTNYGSFSKSLSYTYTKNGLAGSFTNGESVKTDYDYDTANRLRLVKAAGQGSIAIAEYEGYLPSQIIYPGGIKVSNTFDGVARIAKEVVTDPGGQVIRQTEYSYDKVGNILEKNTSDGLFSYSYDKLYRLTAANQPAPLSNRSYEYDEVGNRIGTEAETENWQYNTGHQLLEYQLNGEVVAFQYDDNGNTIEKTDKNGTETYIFDVTNRLTEVKRNGSSIAKYGYDAQGRRIFKEVNGVKTWFLYSHQGLVGTYNESGNVIQSYQYAPGSPWGTAPLSLTENGETYYYQHDQLGSPNLLTKKNGQVQWKGMMDAFGAVTETVNTVSNPLRFPGQYFDVETGYHQNYFRDYDPVTGRYIESDPIGLLGGLNHFVYVDNSPVLYFDSKGLEKWRGTELHVEAGLGFYKRMTLYSEYCEQGKRQAIVVDAYGLNLSPPFPISSGFLIGGSNVNIDDRGRLPDGDLYFQGRQVSLEDYWSGNYWAVGAEAMWGIGYGFGMEGYGADFINGGSKVQKPPIFNTSGLTAGVGWSIGMYLGYSDLRSVSYVNCDCE